MARLLLHRATDPIGDLQHTTLDRHQRHFGSLPERAMTKYVLALVLLTFACVATAGHKHHKTSGPPSTDCTAAPPSPPAGKHHNSNKPKKHGQQTPPPSTNDCGNGGAHGGGGG